MPLTLTAQNAFEAVLKLGSVYGAYLVPGSISQTSMSLGNLLKYSGYATLGGNGASLLAVKICPANEGLCSCDRETTGKIRAFLIRWCAGSLPFCLYVWNSDDASVFKIIGGSFPFLFAFELASELLAQYIRCCPERVIVQRIASDEMRPALSIVPRDEIHSEPHASRSGSEELSVPFIQASVRDRNDPPFNRNSIGESDVSRDEIRPRSGSPEPGSEDFNGSFGESSLERKGPTLSVPNSIGEPEIV